MTFEKVIRGKLILENEMVMGEVGIYNGKIEEISRETGSLKYEELLDFGEQYVFPGFIDAHVHCFSNPNEGFLSTSRAAAAGGITTFVDMPYDVPDPITNTERFMEKAKRVEKDSLVDAGFWATITKTGGTDQIKPLADAGAIAFKLSTIEADPYRFPRIPDFEILKAMKLVKETGLSIGFHAENEEIIANLIKEYTEGNKIYPRAHMETRPPISETSAVLKLLEFAYWTEVKLHIVHVSHPRTIELIEMFKKQGVNVTSETCYPYLLLNVNALDQFGPKAKNNPPLRTEEDVKGLWDHLLHEKIDLITSDHVAWGQEHKKISENHIFKSSAGLSGLEIMVPLLFDHMVVKEGISPLKLAKFLSQYPAEVFQIPNKGKIAIGNDADFTVIDPAASWVIDEAKLRTNAKLTPFHGTQVQGKIAQTIVRGTTVYDGEHIKVEPGYGKLVRGAAYKRG
ncbi:allantoinase [Bacillus oleivorans]|uniref:Allantoinase n=1 Tax=Bacillus oleivorans TaxID=1448271 RepID=A0A285D4D2_9BACI|nr:dihydroorotase [Bacillus oleivorans]SNX74681.1 allantoinase [Bacillus oleivorans]